MKYLKTIFSTSGIKAKKQLGQNFLKDHNICNTIIQQAKITNKTTVLEIGSGLGALTIPSAKTAKQVIAIEKDCRLTKILDSKLKLLKIKNVKLITNDILKINLNNIIDKSNEKITILGNLPYNISTQILIKIIENRKKIDKAILTLQTEVANRICAKPGSKNYNRLAVIMQLYAKLNIFLQISPSMFFPKPKINSSVVEITLQENPKFHVDNEILLLAIIKAAFAKRRKTLKNALIKSELKIKPKNCTKILKLASISHNRRGETISTQEFTNLCNCIYKTTLTHN